MPSGGHYLDFETQEELQDALAAVGGVLEDIDEESTKSHNLQELCQISNPMMESIQKVATALYMEGKFAESLAVLIMLAQLAPEQPDHWFRMGLAAQDIKDYELALRGYRSALEINPEMIGACLFSYQCYQATGKEIEARKAWDRAQKLADKNPQDPMWLKLLEQHKIAA